MAADPQAAQYGQELLAEFGKQRPDFDQIKFLIQRADLSQQNARGQTPLMLATATGNQDVIVLMLNTGAAINQKDKRGETVAHMVARTGNAQSMEFMLVYGANFALQNDARQTPYDLAQGKFTPDMAARIKARFEEQDPNTVTLHAFREYIAEQGLQTERPVAAPPRAVFKIKP